MQYTIIDESPMQPHRRLEGPDGEHKPVEDIYIVVRCFDWTDK